MQAPAGGYDRRALTLLAAIVATSRKVGAESARLAKVRELAAWLRALAPERSASARTTCPAKRRRAASASATRRCRRRQPAPARDRPRCRSPMSTGALGEIAQLRGAGSAARRSCGAARAVLAGDRPRAQFLMRLLVGELRQGALAGVMIDAIAAAARLPPQRVRRAAMYSKNLGAVRAWRCSKGAAGPGAIPARAAFAGGADAGADRGRCRRSAARSSPARSRSSGRWTARASRCTRRQTTVRIYTRALNEVTAAVPEIVEAVRALPARELDPGRRGDRLRPRGPAAPVSGHDAPLRPQAQRRGAARRAADAGVLLRLPAPRGAQPRRSADARALRGAGRGRAGGQLRVPRLVTASARKRPRRSTRPRSPPATKA